MNEFIALKLKFGVVDIVVRETMNSDLYKMKVRFSPVLKKKKIWSEADQCVLNGSAQRLRLFRGAFLVMCCLSSSSKISAIDLAVTSIASRRKEEKKKICLLVVFYRKF